MKSISHSATERYEVCPKSYFFNYVRKLRPTLKNSALSFGNALDNGLNDLLLGKANYEDTFMETWDKSASELLKYSNGDVDNDPKLLALKREDPFSEQFQILAWNALREKGLVLLEEYKEQVMPLIKEVIAVQKFLSLPNGEGQQLSGVIDLIAEMKDGRRCILDNKTSSVKYEADSVQKSPQLATYFAVEKDNHDLTHAGFIVVQKTLRKVKKPRAQIDIIIDTIPDELIKATFERYDRVLGEIRDGNFQRNLNGCKTKFGPCEYYNYCHGGDKTGLEEQAE